MTEHPDPYCVPDTKGHIACPHCRHAVEAATDALDKIAKLAGCEEWDYPGQVVRDVELLVARGANELPTPEIEAGAREILRVWKSGGAIRFIIRPATEEDQTSVSTAAWGIILHDIAHHVGEHIAAHCVDTLGKQLDAKAVTAEVVRFFVEEHDDPTDEPTRAPVRRPQ